MNYHQKNIVHGNITAGGNVHIGDIIYTIERDFKSGSILFLRLDKVDDTHYEASLSVKSKHSDKGTLASTGEKWCEKMEVSIPPQLLDELAHFQTLRRNVSVPLRLDLGYKPDNQLVIAAENHLSQLLFDTFFAGPIGKACMDFIQLLEEQRMDSLLLAISADDETLVNLPFEMILPLLFPSKWGETKKSLASVNFGLVRTSMQSLERFKMQGDVVTAAPLKMLFIAAMPENLDESAKRLQMEAEQNRLVQVIGALPKIVIEFLDNASLDELNNALQARQHDIVHISGHGAYLAAQNKGVLYFENEVGDVVEVSGAALGETLRQHACVKLLILSACETAMAGSAGGVTQQVADYGVPSIVAMRFAVTDEGATIFTTELYAQLAKGLSLTRALAYARAALHRVVTTQRQVAPQHFHLAEWFMPVLYQNQWVGSLIDVHQPNHLPDAFYPKSDFLKTNGSRLVGAGFIGRKRYLIKLRQAFRAGRHVCVHGLGGLGKTTLAEAFAHNYENRNYETLFFRNGNQIHEKFILDELFVRFEETNPLPSVRRALKSQLDDPKIGVLDKLQSLIDHYLKGRKTILIFDNVEDVQVGIGGNAQRSIASEPLRAFLRYLGRKTPPNCHLLFTTRYQLEDLADVVEHIALDKMGDAEQYRLLHYSKILSTIPTQHHPQIYARLDGHPRSYEFLTALLENDPQFRWEQVAHSEEKVFEDLLLAKVFERLTVREQDLCQMVAIFLARTPVAALAAVSGEAETDLMPVLQSLHHWSLCFLDKENQFSVHRLTREWMKWKVTPEEKIKEWALKAGEYFENRGVYVYNYVLAKNYFEIAEVWDSFAKISFYLQDHYQVIGFHLQAFGLSETVLMKNIDEKTNAYALNYNGLMLYSVGQYENALPYLEQSLVIRQKIGDIKGEGETLNNIGLIYIEKGSYDMALHYLERSLATKQQMDNLGSQGRVLNNIGLIYLKKNKNDIAAHYFQRSLVISRQTGDSKGTSETLINIGLICYNNHDYNNALSYFEQSLSIKQLSYERHGEAKVLNNIGLIYEAEGDYDTALRYLKQCFAISQQIDNPMGKDKALNSISRIYSAKGDYNTALYYLEQSLAISQQSGDLRSEGVTLNNISQIYRVKGDIDATLHYLQQYLAIQQQIGDHQGESSTLNNLTKIVYAKGDYETALRYLKRNLELQKQVEDIEGEATALTDIGLMLFKQKRFEEAIPFLAAACVIFQKIGSPDAEYPETYLLMVFAELNSKKSSQK